MKPPLVSIIVPTYQRPHFLVETLKSIIDQSYSNIEIIVVDDGTIGDCNKDICNKFLNVQYFKIENTGGPCKPRNVGISKSRGKYIAFVDDDDIWLPNKIEMQVKVLEENLDFGLAHSYCKVIDENGIETGEIIGRPRSKTDKHGNVLIRMIGNWTLMMPTPLLRKTVVDEVGFFNEKIPQTFADVEYWSRCAFYTKFYYIDKSLVNYRAHNNNMSLNRSKYIDMSIYLIKIVKDKYKIKAINKGIYKGLVLNLCLMQGKMIKVNGFKTLYNLFILNSFWFVNFRIHKTMIKKLIS